MLESMKVAIANCTNDLPNRLPQTVVPNAYTTPVNALIWTNITGIDYSGNLIRRPLLATIEFSEPKTFATNL